MKNYYQYIKSIYFVGDVFILNVVLFTIISKPKFDLDHDGALLTFWGAYNLFWLVLAFFNDIYTLHRITRVSTLLNQLLIFLCSHAILVGAYKGFTGYLEISNFLVFETYLLLFITIPLWRLLLIYALKKYRKSGYNYKNVAIIGHDKTGQELHNFFLEHPEHGYHFKGFFNTLDEVKGFNTKENLDEVYCSIQSYDSAEISKLIRFCEHNLIRVKFLPQAEGFVNWKWNLQSYGILPVLSISSTPLDGLVNRFIKRFFDLLFSSVVILFLLSWLMPIIAILIKIDSKGPIFFRQKRSGINNDDFWCFKLRSMKVSGDAHSKQAEKGDNRITKLGSILRKTLLDESPQFFNVFLGSMSVVGPRPHMVKHTEEYSELIDNYMMRHYVKPGITGLSQVMGYRGETEELYMMRNRIKVDIFYTKHWSLWLDLKIVFMTVYNVLVGEEKAY